MTTGKLVNTLPFKYTFAFGFFISIAIVFGLGMLYIDTHQSLESQIKKRISSEMQLLQIATQSSSPSERLLLTSNEATTDNEAELSPSIQTDTLKLLVDSLPEQLPEQLTKQLLQAPQKISQTSDFPFTQYPQIKPGMIVGAVAFQNPNTSYNAPPKLLLIALPVDNKSFLHALLFTLFYLSMVIFILLAIYSYIVSVHSLRKIRNIDNAAREIMAGNLDKRIPIYRQATDEYSELSKTLNRMLDKMADLMQNTKQVNSHIAHDLRTPLNRLRTRMEIALMNTREVADYQTALADSIDDCDALLATFNALLLIGNLESGVRKYDFKPVPLNQLLQNLAEFYDAIAEEKSHQFRLNLQSTLTTYGNADLLAQALGNLIENAIKYTPDKGVIDVSLVQKGEFALITIADNGPGIPASMHERVFDSFTRLDESRHLPGTGLGMSIVRAVLTAHNATIKLSDNQPGLCIEIRLRLHHGD